MGPSGRFTHINVILDCLGQVCILVELPVQRRLYPIFVRDVGSPDIHECFRRLTGSQRTPGIWGITKILTRPTWKSTNSALNSGPTFNNPINRKAEGTMRRLDRTLNIMGKD